MTESRNQPLLVTAALPYANGPIHLGHLVEYIQADIWVRYWKLRGRDTLYLCADDTHGTPIMLRAQSEGISPEELIERIGQEHQRDFAGFDVEFDLYHSTHSEENRKLSEEVFAKLLERGHIVGRAIEQAYCPQDEMFLPDRYIRGRCPHCGTEEQYGDACEACSKTYDARDLREPYCSQCGAVPEWRESEHLFFQLGDFTEFLKDWVPGRTQEEVANKLKEWFEAGLQDWDISRDAPYFGFEIPGYPGKFFYVWLDAPIGYMAATLHYCQRNGLDFDAYWRDEDASQVFHVIGKDIVYFHALFWPAMLSGASFRTPTGLCVHGFLTVDGEKMSKTRGTFIEAATYLAHLDPQYLRYYYAAKLNSRVEDLDLNLDDFVARVNSDLVNRLANIPSRTVKILQKYHEGRLAELDASSRSLLDACRSRISAIASFYEARDYSRVVRELADLGDRINEFVQEREPWKLAKVDPGAAAAICTAALEGFRVITTLLQPILPSWGASVARLFGLEALEWSDLDRDFTGLRISAYERLVERVAPDRIEGMVEASRSTMKPKVEAPPTSLGSLLRCRIESVTVAGAQKLRGDYWRVELAEGATVPFVVAALGKDYDVSRIQDREILLLGNLEPKKIAGLESQGMLLAAHDGEHVAVARTESCFERE